MFLLLQGPFDSSKSLPDCLHKDWDNRGRDDFLPFTDDMPLLERLQHMLYVCTALTVVLVKDTLFKIELSLRASSYNNTRLLF
jgi:hypothetical protein